jgi:hypothetical protein
MMFCMIADLVWCGALAFVASTIAVGAYRMRNRMKH